MLPSSNGRLLGVGELHAVPDSPHASPPLKRALGIPKPRRFKQTTGDAPTQPPAAPLALQAPPAPPAPPAPAPPPRPPPKGASGLPSFRRKPVRPEDARGDRANVPKKRPRAPSPEGPGTMTPLKKGDEVLVVKGEYARGRVAWIDPDDGDIIVRFADHDVGVYRRVDLDLVEA